MYQICGAQKTTGGINIAGNGREVEGIGSRMK